MDVLEQIFAGDPVPQVCVDGSQGASSLTKKFHKRLEELGRCLKESQQKLSKLQQQHSKVEVELSLQRCVIKRLLNRNE